MKEAAWGLKARTLTSIVIVAVVVSTLVFVIGHGQPGEGRTEKVRKEWKEGRDGMG